MKFNILEIPVIYEIEPGVSTFYVINGTTEGKAI